MKRLAYIAAAAALLSTTAYAGEYDSELSALAAGTISTVAQGDVLVSAIMAQNGVTSGYDQAKIDSLDLQWRAEVGASSTPLIDELLGNEASAYLLGVLEDSDGMFTEIFAMDAMGLNVGQSGVTSDYWQGDEGKWQNTYSAGAGSVDIGEVEEDESTQIFQSQVSIPVLGDDGEPIGAITFGVNVDYL